MKISKRFSSIALAVLTLVSVQACSTAELSDQGGQVEVLNQLDRKDCQNLGPVFGKGGGQFGGAWISDQDLMKYASNDLRNNASEMGATHVVVQTHQMGASGSQYGSATSTATFSGIAYRCPKGPVPASAPVSAPAASKPSAE